MMMIVVMMIIRLVQQHFPDLEISVMFQQILKACRFLTYLVWIPKQFITRTNPSWTVKTFHARPNFHLSGGWLVSMSNLPDHFLQGPFNSSIDDIFTECGNEFGSNYQFFGVNLPVIRMECTFAFPTQYRRWYLIDLINLTPAACRVTWNLEWLEQFRIHFS